MEKNNIDLQKKYYGELYEKHGYSPKAVASGEQIYKDLRYKYLSNVFGNNLAFSLHDVGFGLGHYWEYLKNEYSDRKVEYSGSEVVPAFVKFCEDKYPEGRFYLRDILSSPDTEKYDYIVFGGTFYHLAGISSEKMLEYVLMMLQKAFSMCRRGVVVNFVTSYCEYSSDDLFYCSPAFMLDYVVRNISRFCTIEHNSPLYEFTLCIYKSEYVEEEYPQDEFKKYF